MTIRSSALYTLYTHDTSFNVIDVLFFIISLVNKQNKYLLILAQETMRVALAIFKLLVAQSRQSKQLRRIDSRKTQGIVQFQYYSVNFCY